LFAASAQADTIREGTYTTEGESHYENGEITFKYDGLDTWIMTARLMNDGRVYDTKSYLTPTRGGNYDGSGIITVQYGDNRGCKHRFGLSVKIEGNHIYLRENTPHYIPYNPNGACTAAGPYVWFSHDHPYIMPEM